jgi:hypothetical protein
MAKNDTIILDGILDERIILKLPSDKIDEAFEYFAIEQILKDSNLSKEDILLGNIDGRNDGGIDAFYILINGHLLVDPNSFYWPRTNAELEVHIITCKHHDTFKQAPLDNIIATLSEIFDLSIEKKDFKGSYNTELLKSRELLKTAYRKLASRISLFRINISYASRGDTSIIGDSIVSRGKQIETLTAQLFGACDTKMCYFGSTELVELNRKVPNFSIELPFVSVLGRGERYVLLSPIEAYYKFISDDTGKLRRYLFDSNVRDFMGLNRVNEDIKFTLENVESPDFWWLNNGITILATSAQVIGNTIHIEDIQIVNGLQTSESIFNYFSSSKKDPNDRAVLVKVIVSKEPEIRDAIIRATNNQTNVDLSALHATDKIQRDIDDVLFRNGVYYERRFNFYTNQGVKQSLIITPLYLASGYLSLILRHIETASQLKSKFMRSPELYERIFSERIPLDVWPKIAKILKQTDSMLERLRPKDQSNTERFLKRWRHLISFLTISRLLGRFDYGVNDLIRLDLNRLSDNEINDSWIFIQPQGIKSTVKSKWLTKGFVLKVLNEASERYNISGIDVFSRRVQWPNSITTRNIEDVKNVQMLQVSSEFVEKVNKLFPEQPWKPGVHLQVAKQLNCTQHEVYSAVAVLIKEGLRFRQKDGVLYDSKFNIISFDADRVDFDTLKLKE